MDHTIDPRVALVPEGDREAFLKLEEQARAALRQIAELQATVVQIRVQQNSFLPALRVTDDILIAIFSHTVDPADVASYAKHLVILTSVCSRWRAVATAVPGLWTSIRLAMRQELASLFFTRSRSALLSLDHPMRDSYSFMPKEFAALVGPRLDRIRALRIGTFELALCKEWMDRLSTLPAPALQHLTLTMHKDQFVAGSPVFANETPSLRSLSLRRIVYPPTSPLFSNLQHLSLGGLFGREGYQLRPLLEILSRSPHLETLALEWAGGLGEQHRGPAPRTTRVPLARLRRFHMAALQPFALRAIPHLILPDDTPRDITVQLSDFAAPAEDGQILDDPLALKGATFARFATEEVSRLSITLSVYREERPAARAKPLLALKMQTELIRVPTVMDALDLRTIVRFEVDVAVFDLDTDAYEVYWRRVLERMPALRTLLILRNTYMGKCLAALTTRVGDDGDQGPACICPVLEHLELRGVLGQDRFWSTLGGLVTARWSMSSPLKSISLSVAYGPVDDEVVSAIRERVDTVTVHRK